LQWNDSIDGSPERMTNRASRLHLPSPKRKIVSPLKKYEVTKFVRRRKIKRWSLLEEDTLRTAVQKYVPFFLLEKNTLIEYIFENRRIFLLIQVINKLNIPL
jgi:hypothetical protein